MERRQSASQVLFAAPLGRDKVPSIISGKIIPSEYEFNQLCAECCHRIGRDAVEACLRDLVRSFGWPIKPVDRLMVGAKLIAFVEAHPRRH